MPNYVPEFLFYLIFFEEAKVTNKKPKTQYVPLLSSTSCVWKTSCRLDPLVHTAIRGRTDCSPPTRCQQPRTHRFWLLRLGGTASTEPTKLEDLDTLVLGVKLARQIWVKGADLDVSHDVRGAWMWEEGDKGKQPQPDAFQVTSAWPHRWQIRLFLDLRCLFFFFFSCHFGCTDKNGIKLSKMNS